MTPGGPVSHGDLERREREFRRRLAIEVECCRRNPVYWLERYAWTSDEHERVEPKKKLIHAEPWIDPATLQPGRELDGSVDDYLLYLAAMWWNEDLLAVPKSRQLRVTHLMVNLHGWLAMMYEGQRVAFQSKKFEDADETLQRLDKSFSIMREKNPYHNWPVHRYKKGRILFPNGSIIMAVAQGPRVVRQYTFSAIFSDETAFQDEADDAFTAAIPTIEGGGKYTAVSSAEPGFFEQLVKDQMALD